MRVGVPTVTRVVTTVTTGLTQMTVRALCWSMDSKMHASRFLTSSSAWSSVRPALSLSPFPVGKVWLRSVGEPLVSNGLYRFTVGHSGQASDSGLAKRNRMFLCVF